MKRIALLLIFFLSLPGMVSGKDIAIKSSLFHRVLTQEDFAEACAHYYLYGPFNLKGKNIKMPNDCTIHLVEGTISNGSITGDATAMVKESAHGACFSAVELLGTWSGAIRDSYFQRTGKDDDSILSSVLRFNEVFFDSEEYNMQQWKSITLNAGDVVIHGNGVRIILPEDKGPRYDTEWGVRLKCDAFINAPLSACKLEIHDLCFSDTFYDTPVIYYYLYPDSRGSILLDNVSASGTGGLLGVYNTQMDISSIQIRNCSVTTAQFAVEIANIVKGKTSDIEISGSKFVRKENSLFVGPLSIVCDSRNVEELSIHHCTFMGEISGNVEASGICNYSFCNNLCHNHFAFSGTLEPVHMSCKDNSVMFSKLSDSSTQILQVAGKYVDMTGNEFVILTPEFPRLELVRHSEVNSFTFTGNTMLYQCDDASDHMQYFLDFKPSGRKQKFVFAQNEFYSKTGRFPVRMNFPKRPDKFENPFPKDAMLIKF